jgi:dihydroorotate dehydrogenase electron transfer subunit
MSCAVQSVGEVLAQRELAEQTYALRIAAPELAKRILPGQFFMIRPAGGSDPLLGRPFALYDVLTDTAGQPSAVEFVYHTVGKLTGLMPSWTAGEQVVLWGPLGNGFPPVAGGHLLCVGGGIGYTPFPAVFREALGLQQFGGRSIEQPLARGTFCYGARTAAQLADLEGLAELPGMQVEYATDDGSRGHQGLVTTLLQRYVNSTTDRPDAVYCCGPEPMMRAVAKICEAAEIPCWLSLETPMACGFGACFSCVTKVKTEDGWDYRRTCVEGPIFDSRCLELA